ncbi:MAG: cation-translocating P-type ATPase [Candidatus Levyibacteriota bacterium]
MNRPLSEFTAGGLSAAEAAARFASDGPNELPSARPLGLIAIALQVLREPMFLLLIGACAIYLLLGDIREAAVLFMSVFVVMGITFFQERKTERALEALRELASPRTQVLRDGHWKTVAGREVVMGDVIMVREGDRVPADALLMSANNVTADESLLTGESVPVRKRAVAAGSSRLAPEHPGGDDLPFVYSGSLVTSGQGIAQVTAIGARTELGRIGKALETLTPEPSPIQIETRRAIVIFAAIGLSLCALVTVLFGLLRGDWLNGLLAGITLAMANLPEEFPVVLTVFLALGAWRISRRGVLTRRAPAIETLGATTVLCVDKTGTLTENRMAVRRLWANGREIDLQAADTDALPELLELSILASERAPFDPMERAYRELARQWSPDAVVELDNHTLAHSYALTPEQLSVAYIWRPRDRDTHVVAAKGAPEAIMDLCALDQGKRGEIQAEVARMAADGLRVLAVARGDVTPAPEGSRWPAGQRELKLSFVGLTGLADPVRTDVPAALAQCYGAGIRTVMITGDYPGTARAIAHQIGLANPEMVTTGAELAAMPEPQLRERVARCNVFARVVPEQKLRLVEVLKANGETVAMTGDGVNDAPALKAAHIGVAMGRRGSDVAREAASLVLLEDDFGSMVEAVRLGRRIFDNIQKAMRYIVAVHVPTAGMALLPLLFGWPLVLYPVHIVFLEFVIDPASSIAFEAEPAERAAMSRPPRRAGSRLFDAPTMIGALLQGAGILLVVATLYGAALAQGTPAPAARAMAFATMVLGNLGMILVNRSRDTSLLETLRRPNPATWWVIGGTLAGLALALYVDAARDIFRFDALNAPEVLACATAAGIGIAWLQLTNRLRWHNRVDGRASRPPLRGTKR